MSKKETIKFIVQMIASIATAIVTALGATSCMGYYKIQQRVFRKNEHPLLNFNIF